MVDSAPLVHPTAPGFARVRWTLPGWTLKTTKKKELPNPGLLPANPDAAHSIPGGLLCLLSGHAAEPHVMPTKDSALEEQPKC